MKNVIIKVGNETLDLGQFINRVEKYDVELTRKEVYDVIEKTKSVNPSFVPFVLDAVKKTYHISLAF